MTDSGVKMSDEHSDSIHPCWESNLTIYSSVILYICLLATLYIKHNMSMRVYYNEFCVRTAYICLIFTTVPFKTFVLGITWWPWLTDHTTNNLCE